MATEGKTRVRSGFIYFWTLAHRLFADQRYLTLAERAARYSWEQADTVENVRCGLAGQAYALLNFYKYTGEESECHSPGLLMGRMARPAHLCNGRPLHLPVTVDLTSGWKTKPRAWTDTGPNPPPSTSRRPAGTAGEWTTRMRLLSGLT